MTAAADVTENSEPRSTPRSKVAAQALMVGLVTLASYLSPWREVGTDDTTPNALLPLNIVNGDGLVLDRFRPVFVERGTELKPYVKQSRGHVVSLHPIGTALVAL